MYPPVVKARGVPQRGAQGAGAGGRAYYRRMFLEWRTLDSLVGRQQDGKGRAHAELALDPQLSLMLLDDFMGQG